MLSNRHLAAVMFADIAGYTALMELDEKNALVLISRFKEVLEKITLDYKGRIIQYFGDGCLIVFESSTNGIDCAMALQKGFNETPVVPVRIGMHLGEVLFNHKNVFGDGVNIASRIESLGIPGSILVSKPIRDQLKNKSDFLLVSLGAFDFKNVSEPVEVFALANPGFVVPKREEMNGKLKIYKKDRVIPKLIAGVAVIALLAIAIWLLTRQKRTEEAIGEKSVAVLYFDNMTGDKEQDYFSDGLTEEINNILGNIKGLTVIARTSVLPYRGKPLSARKIADELNADFLLEGSYRKSGNIVKITAQLIKGKTGSQYWSEAFTREAKDILELQIDIAFAIAHKLEIEITPAVNASMKKKSTSNVEAFENFQKGYHFLYNKYFQTHHEEDFEKSKLFFEKAIQLDPNYAEAYAGLAEAYDELRNSNMENFPDSLLFLKEQLARKALQLNPRSSYVNTAMAWTLAHGISEPKFDSMLFFLKKAYFFDPADALANWNLSNMLYIIGLNSIAIPLSLQAIKVDPINPINYSTLGLQYGMLGKYSEAKQAFLKSLELTNEWFLGETDAINWLIYLGEFDVVEKRLKLKPDYKYEKSLFYACKGEVSKIDTLFRYATIILLATNRNKILKNIIKELEKEIDNITIHPLWNYDFLATSFWFDAYRSDIDFKRVLAKAKKKQEATYLKYGKIETMK